MRKCFFALVWTALTMQAATISALPAISVTTATGQAVWGDVGFFPGGSVSADLAGSSLTLNFSALTLSNPLFCFISMSHPAPYSAWVAAAGVMMVITEIPTTQEMMRGPMMQAALEERFKLRIHRVTRAVPVYELTVAEGGPRLQKSQNSSCIPYNPEVFEKLPAKRIPGQTVPIPCGAVVSPHNGTTDFPGTTIRGFCINLSSRFDRDVLDKTGLGGFFDIHVDAEQVTMPMNDASAKPLRDGNAPQGPRFRRSRDISRLSSGIAQDRSKSSTFDGRRRFPRYRPHRETFPELGWP